jgi:mono/diheme cytochrome c family protein
MRPRLAIAIAAFLVLLVGLPAALAQESTPEPGVSGERDFRVYCASCHGEDAKGGGPASFGLTVEPPDLTGLSLRNNSAFPRERILNLIDGREEVTAHGTREMPVWGDWF